VEIAKLSDEQRRALRFLMRHPHGCTEGLLLAQGFTVVKLRELVFSGLAKIRAAGRQKVFLVTITEIGRKAITE
jgi:hypothetical protein